jgi:hypothetical protein
VPKRHGLGFGNGKIIEYEDDSAGYVPTGSFTQAFRVQIGDVTGFSVTKDGKMLERTINVLGNGTLLASASVPHGTRQPEALPDGRAGRGPLAGWGVAAAGCSKTVSTSSCARGVTLAVPARPPPVRRGSSCVGRRASAYDVSARGHDERLDQIEGAFASIEAERTFIAGHHGDLHHRTALVRDVAARGLDERSPHARPAGVVMDHERLQDAHPVSPQPVVRVRNVDDANYGVAKQAVVVGGDEHLRDDRRYAAANCSKTAKTSSSCVLGVTLGITCATMPSGPMMKVARSAPRYLRPYIDFSAHTPYASHTTWSSSASNVKSSACSSANLRTLLTESGETPITTAPASA